MHSPCVFYDKQSLAYQQSRDDGSQHSSHLRITSVRLARVSNAT
jgi:hypothetical protein